VTNRVPRCLVLLGGVLCLASLALAQLGTGAIEGKVADKEGFALPGAFIYASSPALLGNLVYITSDTGLFHFRALPPGRYRISIEMPGFKTITIKDIQIRLGQTVTFDLAMETSAVEEEVTLPLISPQVDFRSVGSSVTLEANLLAHLPLPRTLAGVVQAAPGVVAEASIDEPRLALGGSSVRSSLYALDGAVLNDPVTMTVPPDLNFDVMDEVEVATTARPVADGDSDGGFIRVIAKSGSNSSSGSLAVYHTSEGLAKSLWPTSPDQTSSTGFDKKLWDGSFSLGAPVLSDRGWYFLNARMLYNTRPTSFQSWTDPQGQSYGPYDWNNREVMTFFKTSVSFMGFRFSGLFSFWDRYQAVADPAPAWNLTRDGTRVLDDATGYVAAGLMNYALTQTTQVDLNVSFTELRTPLYDRGTTDANPRYLDAGTGYIWGSGGVNEWIGRKRFQGGAQLTHFQERALGGNHELRLGGEYEQLNGETSSWKGDNLVLTYLNGSPYFYGQAVSPTSGNTVGKGLVSFYLAPSTRGALDVRNDYRRLGAFVQDSWTIAGRLTFQLGLRFDHSDVRMPAFARGQAGNAVAIAIGDDLIKPAAGVNPYAADTVMGWNNQVNWNAFSPRLGVSLDVLGNGRIALKAGYARIPELLTLFYASAANPFQGDRLHSFEWYDENMNGLVETTDSFVLTPDDYRIYDPDYMTKRINPGLKPPLTEEWTFGIEQDVLADLSVALNFVSRTKSNIIGNVLYDPDSNRDWYAVDPGRGWWVPFTTIVPGNDVYDKTPVTVYFRSATAPTLFERLTNVPELRRTYRAVELTLQKRMSHGWQFLGSITFSRATGTAGLSAAADSGFTLAALNPNALVNLTDDARLDLDRPLVAKLMGTARLPLGFDLGVLFIHSSGAPWARSVTVVPPADWAEAHGVVSPYAQVYLERPGARRYPATETLDLRIEKELPLKGFGRLGLYVDVLNLLSAKYSLLNGNDGGFWYPDAENSATGTRLADPSYNTFIERTGARIVKLSLSLRF
jgi:hypothetical protein